MPFFNCPTIIQWLLNIFQSMNYKTSNLRAVNFMLDLLLYSSWFIHSSNISAKEKNTRSSFSFISPEDDPKKEPGTSLIDKSLSIPSFATRNLKFYKSAINEDEGVVSVFQPRGSVVIKQTNHKWLSFLQHASYLSSFLSCFGVSI